MDCVRLERMFATMSRRESVENWVRAYNSTQAGDRFKNVSLRIILCFEQKILDGFARLSTEKIEGHDV
jgi:hypothetical protein